MSPRFISEKITVVTDGLVKQPASFTWRTTEYKVADVTLAWSDWGFPQGSTQKDWRARRHRNYYRVKTETGETFELYIERGPAGGRADWYLYQQLD